jgi:Transposase DDE domain group 1
MPKGPRKFYFAFEKSALTRFGGLSLFQAFCRAFAIRHFLQLSVRWPDYDYRDYHPADLFLAHVFSIVAGLGRIENTQCLIHNGLIPPLLGLNDFPHRDTLRTFLLRFGPESLPSLQAAHDKVRSALFRRLSLLYSATVDADTTTLITYGSQEGVARGYVPKRRHWQPSYAPLLSSEGRSGLSLGMELRSGNVHSSTGAGEFLARILGKLPSSIAAPRTRLRLDGAFYDRKIIEPLENQGFGQVIVARMYKRLTRRMVEARYQEFARGWEAGEFTYTPFHWKREHRFVAVRRPVAAEPEEVQRRLFTFKKYTYHRALVTNLDLTPPAVWRFYCDRGAQELLLRELKDSYAMSRIPTHRFWANAAYAEAILWAYDLVLAFQQLCLPPELQHWNISTLRRELWWLPAEWIRRDHRNVLVLPASYPRQDLFVKIHKAAAKVRPLI